ncbi:hypothetical protein [uncultured Brevundimonas sp.]|uniref:hypothetical protein n=1 Tax=uncultured Brevundimonas sp. TaxID=213418 RepID=UPI0030EB578E
MRMMTPIAAAILLGLSSPVLAQSPAPSAPAAKSAADIAFESRAQAFQSRMSQMQVDYQAAITGAGGDQTRGMADVEVVLTRYQPDIDRFIADFNAYIDARATAAPDDAARQELMSVKDAVGPSLRGMADDLRNGAREALSPDPAPGTAPQ